MCYASMSVCFMSLSPPVVMFLRDPLEEWQEKQCIHVTGFLIALTIMLYCLLKPQESMRSGFETERMTSGVINGGLYEENLHINMHTTKKY